MHVRAVSGRRDAGGGLHFGTGKQPEQVAGPPWLPEPQRSSGLLCQHCPHGLLARPIPGYHHIKPQATHPEKPGPC
jgi:hypothetical protein